MNHHDLAGRVIAITGATGGLGRAAAEALRAQGAQLALLDLDLAAVTKQAAELGGGEFAAGWAADVCSLPSLETALGDAARHFGGIDIVIAGAGVATAETMETMDPRRFDRILDINLNGVWRTFRAALPYVKARRGYLLAISSMAAFVHGPLNAHYAASKAGVWAMCDSLRLELKHLGVGVGTFHPTFFKTPMMEAIHADPGGSLVWNHHKGMWKFVELEEVVSALVDCVERRRDLVTVPRRHQVIARVPGLVRRIIEMIGMDDGRVAEAVRLSGTAKKS